jgi:hypothetical protein
VLQPPRIRHRVLECSPGLEVVEVSSPAEHYTHADLELELPTAAVLPERDFGGQRFTRHVAAAAAWSSSGYAGFEARDLGLAAATSGFATARVLRAAADHGGSPAAAEAHDAELLFGFVAAGHLELRLDGESPFTLSGGDAFVVPAGRSFALASPPSDAELLEVVVGGTSAA